MTEIKCIDIYKLLHPKKGKIVEEIGEELLGKIKEEDKELIHGSINWRLDILCDREMACWQYREDSKENPLRNPNGNRKKEYFRLSDVEFIEEHSRIMVGLDPEYS